MTSVYVFRFGMTGWQEIYLGSWLRKTTYFSKLIRFLIEYLKETTRFDEQYSSSLI
jgi:hypothetical protein